MKKLVAGLQCFGLLKSTALKFVLYDEIHYPSEGLTISGIAKANKRACILLFNTGDVSTALSST